MAVVVLLAVVVGGCGSGGEGAGVSTRAAPNGGTDTTAPEGATRIEDVLLRVTAVG